MNKLIIIGNGFDLAHGLKTKYSDLINSFWESLLLECDKLNLNMHKNNTTIGDKLPIVFANEIYSIQISNVFALPEDYYINTKINEGLDKVLEEVNQNFIIDIKNSLFEFLLKQIEIQNWVDIENEYYEFLLEQLNFEKKKKGSSGIIKLNYELDLIKNLLVSHLQIEQSKKIEKIESIHEKVITNNEWEPVISFGRRHFPILRTLVINFNYTNTFEKLYLDNLKDYNKKFPNRSIDHIHIHGDINDLKSNPIIFGYGDELDKNSKDLAEIKGSEFFKNIKSLNYQSTSHYKSILKFIDENKFEVIILGHSCGNSDRTLLNTIFEHENCTTIQPYYHKWDDGDNYFDIVCNIYRNFTKNASFREKVVEKNLCETLT